MKWYKFWNGVSIFFQAIVIVLMFLVASGTFFFPVILAIVFSDPSNLWFFFVSWIPTSAEIAFFGAVIQIFD